MHTKTPVSDTISEDSSGYPLGLARPIRVSKVKDARRLLARLIREFQKGTVDSRWAKDLTYMLISYVQICRDTEFEERLQQLEERIDTENLQGAP